jgi:hypothetical protein
MEKQVLKFYELEGESVKGKYKVTHFALLRIIGLFIGAIILLYLQFYFWSDPVLRIVADYYVLLFIGIICIILAILEILNKMTATLYITNYRLVEEGKKDRKKTVVIRDYHYDFFESVEIISSRKKKKKPVNKITIEVVGFGKISYILPLKLCLEISEQSRKYLVKY